MSDKPNGAAQLEWNGRAVRFVEFSILEGREVRAAYQADAERGTWALLAMSARYVDDGTPVFASADEILAQPWRLQKRLTDLASAALELNSEPLTEGDDPSH